LKKSVQYLLEQLRITWPLHIPETTAATSCTLCGKSLTKLCVFHLASDKFNTFPFGNIRQGKCICQIERKRAIRLGSVDKIDIQRVNGVFQRWDFMYSRVEKTVHRVSFAKCICQIEHMRNQCFRKEESIRLDEELNTS
jgi:hypothetical protein